MERQRRLFIRTKGKGTVLVTILNSIELLESDQTLRRGDVLERYDRWGERFLHKSLWLLFCAHPVFIFFCFYYQFFSVLLCVLTKPSSSSYKPVVVCLLYSVLWSNPNKLLNDVRSWYKYENLREWVEILSC